MEQMSIVCNQCGREVQGEGVAFCPWCGARLQDAAPAAQKADPEAEKWIAQAQGVSSYLEKKKILTRGLEACPNSREIAWELLFIGEEGPRKGKVLDFSIIRCWALEIYRKPGELSEAKRTELRGWLFDAPWLTACFNRYEDPQRKQQEYLLRLCREYISIFLEGDSRLMGNLFGFSVGKNKEKRLAGAAAEIIARMKTDEVLAPEQRELLWKSFYQAYALNLGKTEYLDAYLSS